MEDKFLIVLDIQQYYTNNNLPEASAQKLIDSVNYVISNTNPDHIVYIKSIHKVLNLALSYPFVFVTVDTLAMRFDKRMNLVNKRIYTKEKANSFSVNALTDFLKQNEAKKIVIIGLMAEQCVYESLIEGNSLGYEMYVIPEAVAGKSDKSRDKALKKLVSRGVKILDIIMLNKTAE